METNSNENQPKDPNSGPSSSRPRTGPGPVTKKSEKAEKKGGNPAVLIVLVLSLIVNAGLAIALFMQSGRNSEYDKQIAELQASVNARNSEVAAKTVELENLSSDLERIREEREKMGLDNEALNEKITSLNATIEKLKKTSNISPAEKKKLEGLIAELKAEIRRKDEEIASLRLENDSLTTGLVRLSEERQMLGDSLNYTAKALAMASVLKAESFKVSALKANDKEMTGTEFKSSKVDRLKVNFSLADNKAAKKDRKDFYLALTMPSGEVFSDPNNGGGVITLANGEDVLYSLNQSLVFDNTNQQLSFTMFKGFNYLPGAYKISVYSEGYKIGESAFSIK